MDLGLLYSGSVQDCSINVTNAIAKPQLLEAKQCMKLFSCTVHECKARAADIKSVSAQIPYLSPDVTEIFQMSLKISFLNLSDHIEDLRGVLEFECLLLCDGVLVGTSPVKVLITDYIIITLIVNIMMSSSCRVGWCTDTSPVMVRKAAPPSRS